MRIETKSEIGVFFGKLKEYLEKNKIFKNHHINTSDFDDKNPRIWGLVISIFPKGTKDDLFEKNDGNDLFVYNLQFLKEWHGIERVIIFALWSGGNAEKSEEFKNLKEAWTKNTKSGLRYNAGNKGGYVDLSKREIPAELKNIPVEVDETKIFPIIEEYLLKLYYDYNENFKTLFNMKKTDKYQQIINEYIDYCKSDEIWNEGYKWQAVSHFQENWNIEATDFGAMFKEAIKKRSNLIHQYPIATLIDGANLFPDIVKDILKYIFNEEFTINQRYSYFKTETIKLAEKLQNHHKLDKLPTPPREAEFAFLLTCNNSKIHYFYNSRFYVKFAKYIEQEPKKAGEKYSHYKELMDNFRNNYVINNQEVAELTALKLPDNEKLKKNKTILTQSIIFIVFEIVRGNTEEKGKYFLVGAYWGDSSPQDQTGRFTGNSIWENGYTDKFIDEVNKIPVNAHIAIKSVYTKEKTKSVMLIKARGIVTKNHNNGRLLEVEWEDDFKPFEVDFSGGYWTTVTEVKKQAHIKTIWPENTNSEENKEVKKEQKCEFSLNQILFGPPGTGKTYHTINKSIQIIDDNFYTENKNNRAELKKRFKDLKDNGQVVFTTFHQSMSYEEFVEGLKPDEKDGEIFYEVKKGIFRQICEKAGENPAGNYVLIIDEINRGNIASIFGELITLIEPDKRKDAEEELFVKLPYSKDEFTVPKNLYIIGTMNTADRSVEALDSALRRRFIFEEMPPDEKLLKTNFHDIDLQKLLEKINIRIEKLIDKDHKIGHSYFMKLTEISDLQNTFKNKLIPLLEEYFYGDFAKIGLILGKDFIKKDNTEENIFKSIDNDEDYSDFESRIIYKIIAPKEKDDFISAVKNIYEDDK